MEGGGEENEINKMIDIIMSMSTQATKWYTGQTENSGRRRPRKDKTIKQKTNWNLKKKTLRNMNRSQGNN